MRSCSSEWLAATRQGRHFEVLVGREIAYYETAKVTAGGLRQWIKTAEAENSQLFRAARSGKRGTRRMKMTGRSGPGACGAARWGT